MDWLPALSEWSGPVFTRIVEAMSADIASGRLVRGQRLPTHRALAKALSVDLTTVTRAYGEARRRGLIDAQVGRGTFISETTARQGTGAFVTKIDLSMNIPPQPVEANLDVRIAQGLKAIQSDYGFSAFLNYQPPGGGANDLSASVKWLRKRVPDAQASRTVIFPGNQSIVFNALLTLTRPGDAIVTEALTFPGMKTAATALGLRLVPVPMDREGVLPDELAKACKQHKPAAVYLTPTQHNPTAATSGPKRRAAVAEVIRRSGTYLIEDDAYGALEPTISPIARGWPCEVHRPGPSRRLSACTQRIGSGAHEAKSPGDRAHAAASDGGAGDAVDPKRRCRQDHHGDPRRSTRPSDDGGENPQGHCVSVPAERAPSVASHAGPLAAQRLRRVLRSTWARCGG